MSSGPVGVTSTDSARKVAYDALRRIESQGAYANIVVPAALAGGRLSSADRRFVTDLVYGTTRMRRACDAAVDRFVLTPPDDATRTLLRLGAYQLVFAGVAPHAAVGETVALAPKRVRGFVNAVLRKVAASQPEWPSEAARLSVPDWIHERFVSELGELDARLALERMNEAPPVSERADGYVQDLSSQWVAAAVEARPGERVLDLCAAPGGKATAMATDGAFVVAADIRPSRCRLVAENVARLGSFVGVVVADGRHPPFAADRFDAHRPQFLVVPGGIDHPAAVGGKRRIELPVIGLRGQTLAAVTFEIMHPQIPHGL